MKKQMEFDEKYTRIVEDLTELKRALYIDKVEDIEKMMENIRKIQDDMRDYHATVGYELDHFYRIIDFEDLLDYGVRNPNETLLALSGREYDASSYFLIDEVYDDITVVDSATIENVYDELSDQLLWLAVGAIENLDELEEGHTLVFNGLELERQGCEGDEWYTLSFKNGTHHQSDNIDCYQFNSPLFSAMIVDYFTRRQFQGGEQ